MVSSLIALNCLLQVEQVNVMESAGGPLVLAMHSLRFPSASQIHFFFFSKRAVPLLMRPRHFNRSCAVCFPDPFGILNSLGNALSVSL